MVSLADGKYASAALLARSVCSLICQDTIPTDGTVSFLRLMSSSWQGRTLGMADTPSPMHHASAEDPPCSLHGTMQQLHFMARSKPTAQPSHSRMGCWLLQD